MRGMALVRRPRALARELREHGRREPIPSQRCFCVNLPPKLVYSSRSNFAVQLQTCGLVLNRHWAGVRAPELG